MNTNNLSLLLAKLLRVQGVIEVGMENISYAKGCAIIGINNFYGYECSKENTIEADKIYLKKINFNWDYAAISDNTGELIFYDEPKNVINNTRGLVPRKGSLVHDQYSVPAFRLQDHKFYKLWDEISKSEPILLKIDAEGMGCRIIDDNKFILNKFAIIQIEVDDVQYFMEGNNSLQTCIQLVNKTHTLFYKERILGAPYDVIFINKKYSKSLIILYNIIVTIIYPFSYLAWRLLKIVKG